MRIFDIYPLIGAGSLTFGMTKNEVSDALNSLIRVSEYDDTEMEQYSSDESSLIIMYEGGLLKAIDFYRGKLHFKGYSLLEKSMRTLKDWLNNLDKDLEITDDALTSYKYGLKVTTDDYHIFENESPQCITIFSKDFIKPDMEYSYWSEYDSEGNCLKRTNIYTGEKITYD